MLRMQEVFPVALSGARLQLVVVRETAAQVVALPKCSLVKSAAQFKWSKLKDLIR